MEPSFLFLKPIHSLTLLVLFLSSTTMGVNSNIEEGHVVPTIPLVTFLEKVQEAAFNTFGGDDFDPKFYVDLSLKQNLLKTVKVFDGLKRSENGSFDGSELKEFIENYFESAGADLVYHDPEDYVPEPVGFLPFVENLEAKEWGLQVHSLWKNLSRMVSDRVKKNPEFHTLLPFPGPVIIPGSRFREVYYWDSYWVIRGLLASKMFQTAKSIVNNLIFLLETYGHVLNGARSYYTNRSQPPLLSVMVCEIYNKTGDLELAKKALPALLKEHRFWSSDIHKIVIQDPQGLNHTLTRYYAMWNQPRPESLTIDVETASKISNDSDKKKFYREVASAAESGWDFSTRWMRNSSDFTTMATTSILPVDLNIFMLRMELDIAYLAHLTGAESIAQTFQEASEARKHAINAIFWNENKGQWLDYWMKADSSHNGSQIWGSSNQNQNVFASNFLPLWIDIFHSDTSLVEKATRSLRNSGLLCEAGVGTSLTNSGQQWDFPNGWAPLQHMIGEGLSRSKSQEAKALGKDIVTRWIRTNYVTFKKTGAMHEKYNVQKCGESGGGGEYIPQTGFGWSNGVVLAFLEEFGWPQDKKIGC